MSGGETPGIDVGKLPRLCAKKGNILDQDVLGWWIVSVVLLLDGLEESTKVILD